jgi:hypothetical protein
MKKNYLLICIQDNIEWKFVAWELLSFERLECTMKRQDVGKTGNDRVQLITEIVKFIEIEEAT